jgi:hypothetical protein
MTNALEKTLLLNETTNSRYMPVLLGALDPFRAAIAAFLGALMEIRQVGNPGPRKAAEQITALLASWASCTAWSLSASRPGGSAPSPPRSHVRTPRAASARSSRSVDSSSARRIGTSHWPHETTSRLAGRLARPGWGTAHRRGAPTP